MRGRNRRQNFDVRVPVAQYSGQQDVVQETAAVATVASGEGRWVDVTYTGIAPTITSVALTVSDPGGLPISYPGYGQQSSLHYDSALDDGETDTARFYVDADGAAAGRYVLGITLSYAVGATDKIHTGTVEVDVTS